MKHVLTEHDMDARTARCAICGPTTFVGKGKGRYACRTARDSYAKANGHGVKRADMLKLKEGAECAICGSTDFLVIDHSHQDGSLRGILCTPCNTGLGKLGDSIETLERALAYLKNPPGVM